MKSDEGSRRACRFAGADADADDALADALLEEEAEAEAEGEAEAEAESPCGVWEADSPCGVEEPEAPPCDAGVELEPDARLLMQYCPPAFAQIASLRGRMRYKLS